MMITYTVKVNDSGTVRWYNEDGLLHRLDGPAVERANGHKSWYQNGNLHRLDGPAVCGSHGGKQWYIGGVEYTEEKFLAKIEIMNCPCKGKKVIVDGVEYTLI
jgi:hypothetical protein